MFGVLVPGRALWFLFKFIVIFIAVVSISFWFFSDHAKHRTLGAGDPPIYCPSGMRAVELQKQPDVRYACEY